MLISSSGTEPRCSQRGSRASRTRCGAGSATPRAKGTTSGSWSRRRSCPYRTATESREKGGAQGRMLQFIGTHLNRFRSDDEEGQTLVEYGLLLALIAIIVIVALLFLGPIVSQIFQNVGTNLQR